MNLRNTTLSILTASGLLILSASALAGEKMMDNKGMAEAKTMSDDAMAKKGMMKKEEGMMKKDEMAKDTMAKEGMMKDEEKMKEPGMMNETMPKDAMAKEDMMKKDGMTKGAMDKKM